MLAERLRAVFSRRPITVWFDEAYRVPLSGAEVVNGFRPGRAHDALSYLLHARLVTPSQLRAPEPASYEALARVHSAEYLESLTHPEALGRIFAADPHEVVVDELMRTLRLACGGTIEAAREALRLRQPCLNLFGGFHHAAPDRGGGFCALNDIAVAIAALRFAGVRDRISVLDLDAHPPDGTTACVRGDPRVWIGSLSGVDWGALEGVDETVLAARCGDAEYLDALRALLRRMPSSAVVFVIAGGDVLAGDRLGPLALSLDGARQRDLLVAQALEGVGSVWLPGGGYSEGAWRVLAGTGLALTRRTRRPIPRRFDPVHSRFERIAREVFAEESSKEHALLTEEDVADLFGGRGPPKLLGAYTAEGIEQVLHRYGILRHIERLGYQPVRVQLDAVGSGDRFRLFGRSDGVDHVLIELVAERRTIDARTVLYVNWLSLRHPRAAFGAQRPKLPGQEVPGLGLSRETAEMLRLLAHRLSFDGVMFRPAYYHTAYIARHYCRFIDDQRQREFEAMLRDFRGIPLFEVTNAVAEGRARLNGEPYTWVPADMVSWLHRSSSSASKPASKVEPQAAAPLRFTLEPAPKG